MNAAAANALLKTLEEPPPGTYPVPRVAPAGAPARDDSQPLSQVVAAPQPGTAEARRVARRARASRDAATACWRRPAARRSRALALADPAVRRSARRGSRRSQRRAACRVSALAARIDAGRARSATGAAGARDRLACRVVAPTWRASRAGGVPMRKPGFRRAHWRRSRRRWRRSPLFRYHRSLLQQRALLAHPLQPRLVAEALLIDYRALFG